MSIHTCHIPTCALEVPPKMLMCRRHWFMVPKGLRAAVWAHYQHGQERGGVSPSEAWLDAANAAIAHVVKRERIRREASR